VKLQKVESTGLLDQRVGLVRVVGRRRLAHVVAAGGDRRGVNDGGRRGLFASGVNEDL